jgi:CBS domain-containing protein
MYIVGFDAKGTMHKPVALRPEQTLADAKNIMIRYNISRVVIERRGRPVGIITEKDIARFLYEQTPARRIDEIRLDEIMSTGLITVNPDSDLRYSAKLMQKNKVSSLVVVDAKNNLKGIFTKTDLVNAYIEYFSLRHKVRAFMTKKVFTVAADEPIHAAIMLMMGNRISRVVVSKNGSPVGIVSGKDLLPLGAYVSSQGGTGLKRKVLAFIPSGIKARMLVSDIMTPDPIVTEPDSDLADAAFVMIRNRISGLPVVGPRGALVGIITKSDIVTALAHSPA